MRNLAKVLLIVLFTAALGLIFVFSALGAKNASQIFQTEFDNINYSSSGGVNYMNSFDGRFISEYDDGYMLYNGHRRVSSKYKNLRLIDGEEGIYEYTTFDSRIGRLDKNGREITKLKIKGKPVNDLEAGAADFYYEYSAGQYYAVLEKDGAQIKSRGFSGANVVYTHSQANAVWALNFPRGVAAGVFVVSENNTRVLANVYNEKVFKLTDIDSIGENYIMVRENGLHSVYSLPEFIKTDEGLAAGYAFVANGVFAYQTEGLTLRVAGGNDYTVPFGPVALAHSYGSNLLFIGTGGNTAFIISGGKVYEGDYEGISSAGFSAYRLGSNIFNSRLEPILSGSPLRLFQSDGRAFIMAGSTAYSYDNISAVKLYDSVNTTYDDYGFLKRTLSFYGGSLQPEYNLYFNDGSAVYDAKGKKISSHNQNILYAENLLGFGDTFKDFKGKTVNGVLSYCKVYLPSGAASGEYIFKKSDGYYSFGERLFGTETLGGSAPIFVRNSKGGLVLVSKEIIAAGDKIYKRADYAQSGIFGDGAVFLAGGDSIKTVYATKRKITENTVAVSGVSSVSLTKDGAVYTGADGFAGFIDSEGESRLDALYDLIEVYGDNLIVTDGENKALYSSDGRRLTAFDYASIREVGTYFFATRHDGKKQLLNSGGKEALKSVTGSPVAVRNYVPYNGAHVLDYEYSYFFVLSNGKYRLIKSAHEGNNYIYNIWNS